MKHFAKMLMCALMLFLSFPLFVAFKLQSVFVGKRKAFGAATQWAAIIPGLTGEWLRRAFLQWSTGLPLQDCCISFGVTFSDQRVRIGDGVYLGKGCDIGYADIGRDCVIGSGVHILSGLKQHAFEELDTPIRDQAGEFSKVSIGEDVWIGNAALVAADIGKKCVIGVGSVVVKPVPDFSIAAGNPARIISNRSIRES